MNGRSIKRNIIKLVIAVVIILLCGAAGYFLGFFKGIAEEQGALKVVPETILRLILMTAFMIALNAVLQLIINAIKGKRKRTQTLTTVTASLVKYVVVIVAIIWASPSSASTSGRSLPASGSWLWYSASARRASYPTL